MLTIIFDVDDTLYNQTIPFGAACEETLGKPLPDPDRAYLAFNYRSNEVFEEVERGEIPLEEYRIQRIIRALGDCGISLTREMAGKFQRQYEEQQKKLTLSPTMKEILRSCKEARVQMGIITNGPSDHQMKKVETLKLLDWIPREHVFISQTVGAPKPHAPIFLAAEEKMGLEKENTYMVGDSLEKDIFGAMDMGWHAIWMNPRRRPCPEGRKPEGEVHSEEEMRDVIHSLIARFHGQEREHCR